MDKRNTIQRELVLQAVLRLKAHATADEVYSEIVKEYPAIGKCTVYRNLKLLSEEGKIRKVQLPDEPERYDHRTVRHYHVKCVKCGRILDVDMEPVPGLIGQIRDTHGIDFIDYDIIFNGICPDCKNKGGLYEEHSNV